MQQTINACPRGHRYRRRRPQEGADAGRKPRPSPPRALSIEERSKALEILDSEQFCDSAPEEVYATLLDEGRYLCSPRTMYRILEAEEQVRERRNQRVHPPHSKPELVATAPEPAVELGRHEAEGLGQVELVLPVRDPGHLLPLRRRLDGGDP